MHNGLSRFQWPSLTARLRREVLIWTDSGDTEIIRNSPFHSKFDVTEDIIAIEELSLIANFQYISVRVKVITGEELAIVKNRVIKQDFFITDAVESYKVVTWKENVGEISLKTKRQVRDWWYVVEDSTTKLTMVILSYAMWLSWVKSSLTHIAGAMPVQRRFYCNQILWATAPDADWHSA